MEFISSRPILSKEVEEKYRKKKEKEEELDYTEELIAEHSSLTQLTKQKAQELKKKLSQLVGNEEIAVKITDTLPFKKETIITIFLSFGEEVEEELINKILEVLSSYTEVAE